MISRSERKYCATRREMLALGVGCLPHFRAYLYGKKFTLRTVIATTNMESSGSDYRAKTTMFHALLSHACVKLHLGGTEALPPRSSTPSPSLTFLSFHAKKESRVTFVRGTPEDASFWRCKREKHHACHKS